MSLKINVVKVQLVTVLNSGLTYQLYPKNNLELQSKQVGHLEDAALA